MRLPLVPTLDSRDGISPKDSRFVNAVKETNAAGTEQAVVRPALAQVLDTSGNGNGLVAFNDELICVYGSTLGLFTQSAVVSTETITAAPVKFQAAVYGNELVAVPRSGTVSAVLSGTWSLGTMPSASWRAVAWNGTVYCAVATLGTSVEAATSSDGLTWTQRSMPGSSLFWESLVWDGAVFIAFTTSSTTLASSADGATWTTLTSPIQYFNGAPAVATIAGKVCAVGMELTTNRSSCAVTSDHGVTWEERSFPFDLSGGWTNLATNGSVYCILVAYDNGSTNDWYSFTSRDGLNWTQTYITTSTATPNFLAWDGVMFVALEEHDLQGVLWVSPDGIAWKSVAAPTIPGESAFNAGAVASGVFYLFDNSTPTLAYGVTYTPAISTLATLEDRVFDFAQSTQ